ncbi:MAG: serine racemase VanT catalytic subunit [Acetatifactor sp.]|nr:serine racemase VanT catalytic subunit [Acetatifactor sp.]
MKTIEASKTILTDDTNAAHAPSRSRAWAEIDLAALAHNVRYLQSLLPDRCALMPVVKANAYGHGAGLIAGELNALGIRSFCVACVSEGIMLRQQNIAGEILVLGYTHPDQFPLLDQYALTQTVVDHAHALALSAYACSASRHNRPSAQAASPLPVHIAVDTGMHRLGEPAGHTAQIREMFTLPGLQVTGMYTHLAAAGGMDTASQNFTQEQIDAFYQLAEQLEEDSKAESPGVKLHLQASYGILRYPLPDVDCARPGIALYGLLSNAADTRAFADKLRPVLSLRARVASVHQLSPGESAGYDMAYTATRPTAIATVTIGYADGLPRSLSEGRGTVLLHGQHAPIVGRICMDQLLADVTAIPGVKPGDIVTLIGSNGEKSISAADMADACGTITNELLCCLGPRLERVAM